MVVRPDINHAENQAAKLAENGDLIAWRGKLDREDSRAAYVTRAGVPVASFWREEQAIRYVRQEGSSQAPLPPKRYHGGRSLEGPTHGATRNYRLERELAREDFELPDDVRLLGTVSVGGGGQKAVAVEYVGSECSVQERYCSHCEEWVECRGVTGAIGWLARHRDGDCVSLAQVKAMTTSALEAAVESQTRASMDGLGNPGYLGVLRTELMSRRAAGL